MPATEPMPVSTVSSDDTFHAGVPDVYFDYDKADIRPDGQAAIAHAAQYLQAHPEIGVYIAGYADERGTSDYNLTLGAKRADAARDALISAGIPSARIEIVSHGKDIQVCNEENEHCWKLNRRAAFSMRP